MACVRLLPAQSKHLKLWKVRFFTLSKRELLYAKKSGQKPRGSLAVQDLEAVSGHVLLHSLHPSSSLSLPDAAFHAQRLQIDDQNEVEHAGNFVFELLTPTRRVFLSAATEKERDAWVAAVRALQAEADGGVSGARHAHAARSTSGLLGRSTSSSTPGVMLQAKGPDGGDRRKRASKERRAERRRRRLPRLKKPFSAVWLEDVVAFPREGGAAAAETSPMLEQLEALCLAGIPKEVRGRAWAWLLGNRLQINEDLFRICKARAQAVQLEISLKRQTDRSFLVGSSAADGGSRTSTPTRTARTTSMSETAPVTVSSTATNMTLASPVASPDGLAASKLLKTDSDDTPMLPLASRGESAEELDRINEHQEDGGAASTAQSTSSLLQDAVGIADMLVAHGERSINLVSVDMPRTFGHHPLFKPGAEGTARTTEVLEAYTCYRPDLGYVQGMSYLAATLCFHMDSFSAFKALVALLSSSLLFDMFRLESRVSVRAR